MKLDSDVTTILRGIIVSAIHDKSLSLASTNANREMAQSLLDDTVDEIVQGFELFQMFWANMVTISLNVGILLSFLGPIAFGILLQTTCKTLPIHSQYYINKVCFLQFAYSRRGSSVKDRRQPKRSGATVQRRVQLRCPGCFLRSSLSK